MPIRYYKSSSIWRGIKEGLKIMVQATQVIFARNSNSMLWFDNWFLGEMLIDKIQIHNELEYTRHSYIRDFIDNRKWLIHDKFK